MASHDPIAALFEGEWLFRWSEQLFKLVLALVLAAVLGLERERQGRPAGLRTHMLVCLGATLVTAVSLLLADRYPDTPIDPTRVMQGVLTGVGFLGAGTIISIGRRQLGLTTAAMVWFVAGLGLTIGLGYYVIATMATVSALVLTLGLGWIERLISTREIFVLQLSLAREEADLDRLVKLVRGADFVHVELTQVHLSNESEVVDYRFNIVTKSGDDFERLARHLQTTFQSARNISFER